jgi:hypothetical protein
VGLVDGHEGRSENGEAMEHVRVGKLLGGEEHVGGPVRTGRQAIQRLAPVAGARRRVDDDGGHMSSAFQGGQLVVLEGDERRDHHRRAVQELPGERVDGRLAGSRSEDGECVGSAKNALDGLALAGTQRRVAEHLPGNLQDGVDSRASRVLHALRLP